MCGKRVKYGQLVDENHNYRAPAAPGSENRVAGYERQLAGGIERWRFQPGAAGRF